MNIFLIGETPTETSQSVCDRHLINMLVSCAQILGAAHVRHDTAPVAVGRVPELILPAAVANTRAWLLWGMANRGNYLYVYSLMRTLLTEYRRRKGRPHRYEAMCDQLAQSPYGIPAGLSPAFPIDLPAKYVVPSSAVLSYRKYYLDEWIHSSYMEWTMPAHIPPWLTKVQQQRMAT